MQVQTVTSFKTITNVVGYLKGLTSPGKYGKEFIICIFTKHHKELLYINL